MVTHPRLILVLGDQLSPGLASLKAADPARDVVVMAEVAAEATYVPHHPKKIAFLFAAMRKHAARLVAAGWRVLYTPLDDPGNTGSIPGELIRRAAETGAHEVIATRPGDWRLIAALEGCPVPVRLLEDDRFICSHAEFESWADGRKALRMEFFYREMRRKTGLMMDGDQPAGGQWNFDHDNRKRAEPSMLRVGPLRHEPDSVTAEVLDLVAARFPSNFGRLTPFWFATDPEGAQASLDHFLRHGLPAFGDEQDAMLESDRFLSHSILSMYINAGLLDPLAVAQAVEAEWRSGRVPINAAEGFIRQIIGWREFIRGIWHREGPDYTARNGLGATRALPAFYWGGETRMACVRSAVAATRDEAYAHHIQRLMVTGNFALLAGIDPGRVHEWYLAVYADAFEWVEAPNVIGMTLHADGGVVGSKPYAASGAYIDRMSDHCGGCHYRVKDRTGPRACPFNPLYWDFLLRHRERFAGNPRMAQMYRTWDKMDAARRAETLAEAARVLADLDAGRVV
ncbi:MAG: cryptochrome/photolyase family protein [Rhodobacteraceae bacterium]|nr:cryptochrome/photolyase family protein [Paracoccaceae bacterium]